MGNITFLTSNWVALISLAGLGILSVFNLIDRAGRENRTESDKASDRLFGILQATVEQLEKKVTHQTAALNDAMIRLISMESENKIIRDIFQGRDETMQEFMKQGFTTMAQLPTIMNVINKTDTNVERLYELISKYISTLEKNV